MNDIHRQAKELRTKLKGIQVKKKYKGVYKDPVSSIPSPYSASSRRFIEDIRKQKTTKVVEKPVYYGKSGAQKGRDGFSPIKGRDYFTHDEIQSIKDEILSAIPMPEVPKLEVDEETVKKIINIMHSLPEADKLEVSKGIRNAQSFIYGGTKYQTSELMHGAGSAGGGILTATGTVNGVNQIFSFTSAPTQVVVDGVPKQKTQSDGTINWTGTTTITLTIAPNYDIYGIA